MNYIIGEWRKEALRKNTLYHSLSGIPVDRSGILLWPCTTINPARRQRVGRPPGNRCTARRPGACGLWPASETTHAGPGMTRGRPVRWGSKRKFYTVLSHVITVF